jgi:hypothetical protein
MGLAMPRPQQSFLTPLLASIYRTIPPWQFLAIEFLTTVESAINRSSTRQTSPE